MPGKRRNSESLPHWARNALRPIDASLALLVVAAPLAIGGMLPQGQVVLSLAALCLLAATYLVHALAAQRWQWDGASSVLAVAAGLTLVRATPVGAVLADGTERAAYALWPELPLLGTVAPGRAPLSALQLLGVAAICQVASARLYRSGGSAWAVRVVLVTWGLAAAVGLIHLGAGADAIFGVYQPELLPSVLHPVAAPFVNGDQAGSLWALAAMISIGAAWIRPSGELRLVLFGLGASIGVGLFVLFDARAAELGLGCGVLVLAVGVGLSWTNYRFYDRPVAVLALLVVLATAVGVYGLLPRSADPGTLYQKARIWRDAWGLVWQSPVFGYGPGAFPEIFPTVASQVRVERFGFVESMPLQFALDHGLPMLGLFGVAVSRSLWRRGHSNRRYDSDIRVVILAVLVVIAVEATCGMGLVALGYAFSVALLYGVLAGQASRPSGPARGARAVVGAVVWVGLVVGTLPRLGVSTELGATEVRVGLGELLESRVPTDPAVGVELGRLARLAPASPAVIGAAAWVDLLRGDLETIDAKIDYLRRHAPGRRITWELAFERALRGGDTEGACAALAQMAPRLRTTPAVVTERLERLYEDVTRWLECFPEPAAILPQLFHGLRASGRHSESLALALHVLGERPDDRQALLAAVISLTALGTPELGELYARRLTSAQDAGPDSYLHASRMYSALGDIQQQIAVLTLGLSRHPGVDTLRIERLSALAADRSAESVSSARVSLFVGEYGGLRSYAATGEVESRRRLMAGAVFFERAGMYDEARRALHGLLLYEGEDVASLDALARVAEAQGRLGAAAQYRERAERARRR